MAAGETKAQSAQDASSPSLFREVPDSKPHQLTRRTRSRSSLPFLNPTSSCPWNTADTHTLSTKST